MPANPKLADPISYVLVVFIGIDDAREPVNVKSSAVAFPRVTAPLNVAVPATVRAETDISFVPSVTPFRMSLKFCITLSASAVVALARVYVYEGFGMI